MGAEPEPKITNRLYLRLPVKIVDEHQILALHPKIIRVYLPRQKTRRWCTVEFASKSDKAEARRALKTVKIDNKKITISNFKIKKGESKDSQKDLL